MIIQPVLRAEKQTPHSFFFSHLHLKLILKLTTKYLPLNVELVISKCHDSTYGLSLAAFSFAQKEHR
jgi:hypothetical protein